MRGIGGHTWELTLPYDIQKAIGFEYHKESSIHQYAPKWAQTLAVQIAKEYKGWNKKARNKFIETLRNKDQLAFYQMKAEFEDDQE
jgi:hypothetical protein